MPSIQRQTILSSIFIYIGFFIGALNMLIIPFVLDPHELGLTKVINDFAAVAAAISTLGVGTVVAKFYPYYRSYLEREKNDMVFLVVCITSIGFFLVMLAIVLAKHYIIIAFGRNDQEIFTRFYWTVLPYLTFFMIFTLAEPFFWLSGKAALYNLLKEAGFRVLTTGFLFLLLFKLIHFTGFMYLYGFLYLFPAIISIIILYRSKQFVWYPHISKVTKRMKGNMLSFASFLFFTGLLTFIVRVCDTLFLAGQRSFADAGVFIYALYFSQILDVPNRSITGGAVPVLVEYWRTKNMKGIESVYRKSAMNLMIAGLALGGLIIINFSSALRIFPDTFKIPFAPTILLIIAQFINLATGLNAQIIHTSTRWRFDFVSTIIYSIISIPLNFFFIRYMGIVGAGLATLFSSLFYNVYRWGFLYKEFRLQPFQWKNMELLLIAVVLTILLYWLPEFPNVFALQFANIAIDIALRSTLFVATLGSIIIKRHYSQEINTLWNKWSRKPLNLIKK
jgi:O-antigen/teichoic acid export membrane protein